MVTTYQYRIYPTKEQEKRLESNLEACQTLYNQALHWRIQAYQDCDENVSYIKQAAGLTVLRKESPFWSGLHVDIVQDTLRRLDKAFKAFFRRTKNGEKPGFPRFKSGNRYRSITYSHLSVNLLSYTEGRMATLKVPKLGDVKLRYHRPLPDGKVKTLQIIRKASGWYTNLTIEVLDIPKCEIETAVGIDVGLDSFLTTSDGEHIENPRYLRQSEKKLKKLQRRLSKKKISSQRRKKAKVKVAKLHERIANQRRDFHYKMAHDLYIHKEYDLVVVENLQINNMVKNHHLAKSISDAAWGNFVLSLSGKAEKAGRHLEKINPNATSQLCSGCGETVSKTLAIRIHRCQTCDLVLDRDHNAAINILNRVASTLRGGAVVVNTPVETRNSVQEGVFTSPVPLGRGS